MIDEFAYLHKIAFGIVALTTTQKEEVIVSLVERLNTQISTTRSHAGGRASWVDEKRITGRHNEELNEVE